MTWLKRIALKLWTYAKESHQEFCHRLQLAQDQNFRHVLTSHLFLKPAVIKELPNSMYQKRSKSCEPKVRLQQLKPGGDPSSDASFWQQTYLMWCWIQKEMCSLWNSYLRHILSACWGLCFTSRHTRSSWSPSRTPTALPDKHTGSRSDGRDKCLLM